MSATASLSLENQLSFSLYGAHIAMSRRYKPALDSVGITFPQYLVLGALSEGSGMTVSAIADCLALESSTITPLLKRLEGNGLLSRQRNPADERQVEVKLTAKGHEARAEAQRRTDALLVETGWPTEKLARLNTQLRALRDALIHSQTLGGIEA